MKLINDVYQFMDGFQQHTLDQEKKAKLYRKLIREEYKELFDAVDNQDEVEELDACLDLIWVIVGYMHSRGWDIEGGWDEVARSNMAKLDPLTGKAIHRADGKVIKPEGWTPPDLRPFVKRSVK